MVIKNRRRLCIISKIELNRKYNIPDLTTYLVSTSCYELETSGFQSLVPPKLTIVKYSMPGPPQAVPRSRDPSFDAPKEGKTCRQNGPSFSD